MRSSLTRTILLAAAMSRVALGDFHLMYTDDNFGDVDYFTCPSNYFKNACWCGGDRRSSTGTVQSQGSAGYKVTLNNICGVAALDFWWHPNGVNGDSGIRWQAFVPNASGNVEANCYDNGSGKAGTCLVGLPVTYDVLDGWVCYSSICGSA